MSFSKNTAARLFGGLTGVRIMAGDWIKFETATSDKPEVWAMAQSLGIDADAVVGKLLRVWAWFDQQTQEGNAVGNGASVTSSVTKALLDRRVGVSGFCDSMILSGWMADDGQSLTLPNFDRHNGKTAKTRAMTAKRVATHKAKSNATSVTSSVSSALPREEKRREEYSNIDTLPEWLKKDWVRWLDFRFAKDGQWMPEAQADAVILDLLRRGEAKALKDIEFSIRIGAKNICHDDGGQGLLKTGSGSTASPQSGRKLTNAEKTLKLIEDMNNGSI
jgi:hypothetical protein